MTSPASAPARSDSPPFVRRPMHDPWSLIWTIAVIAALGFLVPSLVISGIDFTSGVDVVAFALVLYSAVRIAMIVGRGEPRLLATAAWTFAYSFLTLPLLAQTVSRSYPLAAPYSYSTQDIAQGEVVIALGLMSFEVGSAIAGRMNLNSRTRRIAPLSISVPTAFTIGYIGLAFVALAVAKHGLASFFTSRDALTETFLGQAQVGVRFYLNSDKAAGSSLQALTQAPVFIGAYLLLYVRHQFRHDPGARRPSLWLIAPLIIGNVIVNNPVANARFWYVTVLIGFVTIYLPLRQRKSAARAFVIIFVGVSLFSFHQLAAFRRTGATDFSSQPLAQSLISDPDYASPQQLLNGDLYVREDGYRSGEQLLGTVFVFVPRSIWTTKPTDTGQLVGSSAGFKVSAPLWTEGFVDFGYIGVCGYLFAAGALCGWLDRRYRTFDIPDIVAAFAPLMASLLVFVLRGSLQPAFGSILPVAALGVVCLRRPRPTRMRELQMDRVHPGVVIESPVK